MGNTSGSAGRGGKEPKSTGGLTGKLYKSWGGGSVSPEVRAAIQKKMAQGLKPEGGPQPAVSPQSRAESRFPPRAPAVRVTKGTAKPAPKPSIPTPRVSPHPVQQGPAKAPVKRAPDTKVIERVDHSTDSTIRTSGTSIKRSRGSENWRVSGLEGRGGVLGGEHMGGHSDVSGGDSSGVNITYTK